MDWQKDVFSISDDPAWLDVDRVYFWLSENSYWAKGIPRKTVEASIAGSFCFGVYATQPGDVRAAGEGSDEYGGGNEGNDDGGRVEGGDHCGGSERDDHSGGLQVGFARVITDKATFAYLADVFVDPAFRGRGLSKWLMEVIVAHPELQGLRNWMLQTLDAQGLYKQFGFIPHPHPERMMTRSNPDVYKR